MTKLEIEIKYLVDCKEHIPKLASLQYEEISRHWVSGSSIETAKKRLSDHANIDCLPFTIVALDRGQPIGMASLRINDGIRPDLEPWLGSLVVSPLHRGLKVGEKLIEAIKTEAITRGYEKLYLLAFDPTIPDWYTKLGWNKIGMDQLFTHPVTVMDLNLITTKS